MSDGKMKVLEEFQWSRQPGAEKLVRGLVEEFLQKCEPAEVLARRMKEETGTRFFDWVDYLIVPSDSAMERKLEEAGYRLAKGSDMTGGNGHGTMQVFEQPDGIFPKIVLSSEETVRIAIKVDSVVDYLSTNQLQAAIEGETFSPLRRAVIARGQAAVLEIVERRGWHGIVAAPPPMQKPLRAVHHLEQFRCRRRDFASDEEGFGRAMELVRAAIGELGVDQACSLFFAAEREFWQRRNRAAQVQKARQDRLGLGWANHDHHTYRSSRVHFHRLIAFHEMLGLECRERFYAGREAGWGAQVMENPRAGIITFNDVDLSPEELVEDFAHKPLASRETLGTVGLWCGLHGEAFLEAGMHHLECQFDFDALRQQLEGEHGIGVMKPFTDYPYLRQAFTQGERWPVREERLQELLGEKLITTEQAEQFRTQGAIGSHLENLERNEGYKGFNQKGVSEIISATDPRKQVAVPAGG